MSGAAWAAGEGVGSRKALRGYALWLHVYHQRDASFLLVLSYADVLFIQKTNDTN